MKQILKFLLVCTAFLPLQAVYGGLFLEVGGATGHFIGLEEDYVEADLFYVMECESEWAPLFDAHGYFLEDDTWAGSAGIGLRYQGCDSDRLYGVNFFYDVRELNAHFFSPTESKHRHRCFHRGGIGFESLGTCVDYRINAYIPIGKKVLIGDQCYFNNIGNGYEATISKTEYLPTGFDAEVGFKSPCWSGFSLYGALGGYYFYHDKFNDFGGPMARLDLNWNDWISLEGRYSYDNVNHSAFQGRMMLTIPLSELWDCCSEVCECINLFNQPLQRNGLIFTDSRCCWNYNW